MSGWILSATIEQNPDRSSTRYTIDVAASDEFDCPNVPAQASFGDDWICLQDSDVLEEMGYWQIAAEGTPMLFLRLAWMAAHAEMRERQKR